MNLKLINIKVMLLKVKEKLNYFNKINKNQKTKSKHYKKKSLNMKNYIWMMLVLK